MITTALNSYQEMALLAIFNKVPCMLLSAYKWLDNWTLLLRFVKLKAQIILFCLVLKEKQTSVINYNAPK